MIVPFPDQCLLLPSVTLNDLTLILYYKTMGLISHHFFDSIRRYGCGQCIKDSEYVLKYLLHLQCHFSLKHLLQCLSY